MPRDRETSTGLVAEESPKRFRGTTHRMSAGLEGGIKLHGAFVDKEVLESISPYSGDSCWTVSRQQPGGLHHVALSTDVSRPFRSPDDFE